MEFTHDENSLIVRVLNNYIEDVEQRLSTATEALNEGCLITLHTLKAVEEGCELLNTVFDIQEKIFNVHPCQKARESLLEDNKSNRETLAQTQAFLASLAFYYSPTNRDKEENCHECKNRDSLSAKSPEPPEVEKMEN